MMHPLINTQLAKIRQEELLQYAAETRIGTTARTEESGLQERLSLRIGNLLITAGRRLRAPYEPLLDQQPKVYGPGC
jgi:hypothetical protein